MFQSSQEVGWYGWEGGRREELKENLECLK
jgi:hypothetical protein